ncbi:MAG: phage shock protein operon transcriptional activator [Candidatus Hydrogenedentes bacterium]|nr:phage shock protein operon transcriptional activator [Candidatus Hydrogenedentota bacterium]
MSDELPDFHETRDESVPQDIHEALGQSDAFLNFQEQLSRAAQVNRPILLVGERGTGKELAATRVHFLSKRWQGPFVTLNCSALSVSLIESELFGHEAGSFTGATGRRTGRFEAANNGTLFLDEIGNVPLEVQEKILRVVEYGTFERVGSSQPLQVDARIVGATNGDLRELTRQGKFMADLLDRLSFDVLFLPPLRERIEDISLLANHFAARMAFELEWAEVPEITLEAMEELEAFPWPGNIRELKNVVERAVYSAGDFSIRRRDLIFDPFEKYTPPLSTSPSAAPAEPSEPVLPETADPPVIASPTTSMNLTDAVRDLELGLLKKSLNDNKFNQRKAADALGLTYHQFRGLYRKYQNEIGD